MNDRVRVSIGESGIAEVCLTRGDKMNALDAPMFAALNAAIEQLRNSKGLRAVVLHGEGRAFCAGLDMASFAAMAGMVLMRGLLRDDVLRELTYTARVVGADEAVALGLGTRVCDDPLAQARALAQLIAGRSPQAVRAAKRLLNQAARSLDESAAALLQAESDEQVALIGTAQQVEAVRARLEKREARFEE